MTNRQYPEFRLDSFNLVNFLFRYWKLFLITGIAAFIISALVSLTIEPMYRSSVVLYPASSISEPGSDLFSTNTTAITFGDEEATEKILQMLQSESIRDYLVEKYNLFEHYQIDPDEKFRYTELGAKMKKYISFRKTQYMSVEINVIDAEPGVAASIANDIASLVDDTFSDLLKDAGKKQLKTLESQYLKQEDLVKAIEDSIRRIGSDGLSTYRSAAGDKGLAISPYSPEVMRFTSMHELALEDLGTIRQRLTEARMASEEDFSYTLIVNEARAAEKKAFPKRSVITIISTLSALLFLMFILIFLDGLMIPEKK